MTARQVFFEGRVQGVGFRYTTRKLASEFDVTGWVRNLADGRVELQIMGEEAEVKDFIRGIQESELAHHIQKTEISSIPPLENVKGFTIR